MGFFPQGSISIRADLTGAGTAGPWAAVRSRPAELRPVSRAEAGRHVTVALPAAGRWGACRCKVPGMVRTRVVRATQGFWDARVSVLGCASGNVRLRIATLVESKMTFLFLFLFVS